MQTITRTEDQGYITYAVEADGEQVSFLTITADTRVVANVETVEDYQRQGLARQLWDAASAEAEVLHAQPHHRTPEGDAFAHAVGGYDADETTDHVAECVICTGDDDEDEDY